MDWRQKLSNTQDSIRLHLGKVRDLESEYILARKEEIVLGFGVNSKRPFLRSRSIDREIKLSLNAALKKQARFNRDNKTKEVYLVESLVESNPIFVRARALLAQIQKRSDAIKTGQLETVAPLEGGYDPIVELEKQKRANINLVNKLRKTSYAANAQDNAVYDILANATKETICEDTVDVIDIKENIEK